MSPAGFEAGDSERQQGLNIVNAAIETGVQHFIWSYVPFGSSTNVDLTIISLTEQRNVTNSRFRTMRQSQLSPLSSRQCLYLRLGPIRADVADYLTTTQLSYTLLYPTFYYSVRVYSWVLLLIIV
jgi:hypothetical protein